MKLEAEKPRKFMPSMSDEEMTRVVLAGEKPVSSVSELVAKSPKSVPPSRGGDRRGSAAVPAQASSSKRKKAKRPVEIRDEDDDSRTMIRQELSPSTLIRAHVEAAKLGTNPTVPAQEEVSSFPGVEVGRSRNGFDDPEHTAALVMAPTPQHGVSAARSGAYPEASRSGAYPEASRSGGYPEASRSGGYPEASRSGAYPEAPGSAPMLGAPFARRSPQMGTAPIGPPAHFQPSIQAVPTMAVSQPRSGNGMKWVVALMGVGLVVGVGAAFFAGTQTGADKAASERPSTPSAPSAPQVAATGAPQAPGPGGTVVVPQVAAGSAATAPQPILNTGITPPGAPSAGTDPAIAAALGSGPGVTAPPTSASAVASAAPSASAAAPTSASSSGTGPAPTGTLVSSSGPNMSSGGPATAGGSKGRANGGGGGGGGRFAGGAPTPKPPQPPPPPRGNKTDEELKAAKAAKDLADLQLKDSL